MKKLMICFLLLVVSFVCTSWIFSVRGQNSPGSIQERLDGQSKAEGVKVKCTRLYADSSGESHFEDVFIELKEADFAPPAPPLFLSDLAPATRYGIISASPGWYGDWHPAPKRQMMFYLHGEVEAEVSDGEVRRAKPGNIVLVEDTTGKGHKSRVVGEVDVIIVVVQLED